MAPMKNASDASHATLVQDPPHLAPRRARAIWAAPLGALLLVACASSGSATQPATPAEPARDVTASTEAAPTEAAAPDEEAWEGEDSIAEEGEDGGSGSADEAEAEAGEAETRTMAVIQGVVKENRDSVRACYDKARETLPSLKGDLTIRFVLDPDGAVKEAEPNLERSTLKSPEVANCAVAAIEKIKFPPSSRGMETTVNYPFNFNP